MILTGIKQVQEVDEPEESEINVSTPALPTTNGIGFTARPQNITIEVGDRDVYQRCVVNESLAEITWYKDDIKLPSGT